MITSYYHLLPLITTRLWQKGARNETQRVTSRRLAPRGARLARHPLRAWPMISRRSLDSRGVLSRRPLFPRPVLAAHSLRREVRGQDRHRHWFGLAAITQIVQVVVQAPAGRGFSISPHRSPAAAVLHVPNRSGVAPSGTRALLSLAHL